MKARRFREKLKRGYQYVKKAAPYATDAVRGYLDDGVHGAIREPIKRLLREYNLPIEFTNNREKRRKIRKGNRHPAILDGYERARENERQRLLPAREYFESKDDDDAPIVHSPGGSNLS